VNLSNTKLCKDGWLQLTVEVLESNMNIKTIKTLNRKGDF
jgi:hypothetical protein